MGWSTLHSALHSHTHSLLYASEKWKHSQKQMVLIRERLGEDAAFLLGLNVVVQGLKGAKTTTELCPPKPNEFEIAASGKSLISQDSYGLECKETHRLYFGFFVRVCQGTYQH